MECVFYIFDRSALRKPFNKFDTMKLCSLVLVVSILLSMFLHLRHFKYGFLPLCLSLPATVLCGAWAEKSLINKCYVFVYAINQQTCRMQQTQYSNSWCIPCFSFHASFAEPKLHLSLSNWVLLSLLQEYHFLMFGNCTVSSSRQFANLLHNVSVFL